MAFSVQTTRENLRYSPKWLDYGFLNELFLRQQAEIFAVSEDKHLEHYRYAAFRNVLGAHDCLDDIELSRYVELAEIDEDMGMAGAALVDLIQWRGLTGEQLQWLSEQPAFAAPSLQKQIARRHLLDTLRAGQLTEANFNRYFASNDSVVQRALLDAPDISPSQIAQLQSHGVSRAIRNLARVWRRPRGLTKNEIFTPHPEK